MTDSSPRRAIRPCLWGATCWDALHYFSLGYPEKDPPMEVQRSANDMMMSLKYLLPCSLCRQHLAEMYQTTMPVTDKVLSGSREWGTYLVRLRDMVDCKHVSKQCSRRHDFDQDVVQRLLYPKNKRRIIIIVLLVALLILVVSNM